MIDIDAEFKRFIGSVAGTSTNNQPSKDEPLTLDRIRDAAAKMAEFENLPNEIRAHSWQDFRASLHPIQRAKFDLEDLCRYPPWSPKSHFGGIPIIADDRVPPGIACMAINGRIVRVMALTEEARGTADLLAKALGAADE